MGEYCFQGVLADVPFEVVDGLPLCTWPKVLGDWRILNRFAETFFDCAYASAANLPEDAADCLPRLPLLLNNARVVHSGSLSLDFESPMEMMGTELA